ncbi:MAG: extradiol dioxygenase [Candidatus Nitrosotenuis sp.]
MIKGIHSMFYTPFAEELRAFFRDKIGMGYNDVGEGWLIFNADEAELGCHPGEANRHDISLFCDDIYSTVKELKSRGVEFVDEVEDHGYGLVTHLKAPGELIIQLYQKKY